MNLSKKPFAFVLFLIINTSIIAQVSFSGPELLGKPSDNSITINIVPDEDIYMLYYEYGTSSNNYTMYSDTSAAFANQPHEIVLLGLSANTRSFYRMHYNTKRIRQYFSICYNFRFTPTFQ